MRAIWVEFQLVTRGMQCSWDLNYFINIKVHSYYYKPIYGYHETTYCTSWSPQELLTWTPSYTKTHKKINPPRLRSVVTGLELRNLRLERRILRLVSIPAGLQSHNFCLECQKAPRLGRHPRHAAYGQGLDSSAAHVVPHAPSASGVVPVHDHTVLFAAQVVGVGSTPGLWNMVDLFWVQYIPWSKKTKNSLFCEETKIESFK
jgi:hypothetical protein